MEMKSAAAFFIWLSRKDGRHIEFHQLRNLLLLSQIYAMGKESYPIFYESKIPFLAEYTRDGHSDFVFERNLQIFGKQVYDATEYICHGTFSTGVLLPPEQIILTTVYQEYAHINHFLLQEWLEKTNVVKRYSGIFGKSKVPHFSALSLKEYQEDYLYFFS